MWSLFWYGHKQTGCLNDSGITIGGEAEDILTGSK